MWSKFRWTGVNAMIYCSANLSPFSFKAFPPTAFPKKAPVDNGKFSVRSLPSEPWLCLGANIGRLLCLSVSTLRLKDFKISANSSRALLISCAGCGLFYSPRRRVHSTHTPTSPGPFPTLTPSPRLSPPHCCIING